MNQYCELWRRYRVADPEATGGMGGGCSKPFHSFHFYGEVDENLVKIINTDHDQLLLIRFEPLSRR